MQDLVEGRTGTLPDGTRVVVRNGQVVPVENSTPAGTTRLANGTLLSPRGPNGGRPTELMKLSTQEQMQLSRARTTAATQRTDLADSERFARLMEQERTGGVLGLPLVGGLIADTRAPYDPEIDEMQEISARLTPAQRVEGSGATSDFEQRLYGRSVPTVSKTPEGNEAVINRGRSRAGESQRRAEFLDWYASRNGTLQGAEQAWNNIYQPPPVAPGTPEPRANVRPSQAQREAILSLPNRDRTARLGTRLNPRAPPQGFNLDSLPAGDWIVDYTGRLQQVGGREGQNQALRNRSRQARSGVASVRRLD